MRFIHKRLVFFLSIGILPIACSPPSYAAAVPVDRFTAPNGMTVLLVERHTLPIVSAQMIIRAGSVLDPEEKAGLSYLTAALLDEGTATRSSQEIAEAIEFVGGSLSISGGQDYTSGSLRLLKKDAALGFELLSDVLLHPTFPERELERLRAETLGDLTAEKDQPGIIADKAFDALVFGPHPYHRAVNGEEDTLPCITRADVVRFHSDYFRPNNSILAVVGDLTRSELQDLLNRFFAGWESGPVPAPSFPTAPKPDRKTVRLIDKDLTQANIVLGHIGIERRNPDFYAVAVMNYILGGGGFSSRMVKTIRDNHGLAYSVNSHFAAQAQPGSFSVSLQTKNSSAGRAIEEALSEIRRIRTGPVTDRELDEAIAFLVGSFPLRMDTNSKLSGLLAQVEYYGLGLDYFELYPKLIGAVTQQDILRVAQKYLDPERIALVVVAKQSEAKIETDANPD
jgi:zinc protease